MTQQQREHSQGTAVRARVRSYIWDRGRPTATPGALVTSATGKAFIPTSQLTKIADALVDLHEQHEQPKEHTE